MNADARPRNSAPAEAPSTSAPRTPILEPGASVVLLRPRKLRGTIAIVRRRLPAGWEVEVRSPEGVPLHLTLPKRALYLR